MPDPAVEREHLVLAEKHISEGERRVTLQTLLIEEMRRDGHNMAGAEKLLKILQETLAVWHDHRDAIREDIARYETLHPH